MNGWLIDVEQTYRDFKLESRRKSRRGVPTPALASALPPVTSTIREFRLIHRDRPGDAEAQASGAKRGRKPLKDKTKKRGKKEWLPPPTVLPATRNRREVLAPPLDAVPDLAPAKGAALGGTGGNGCELDVFIPTLIVRGRPAPQLHYAKLTRFVRSLRDVGKNVPFLLRNIVVEVDGS